MLCVCVWVLYVRWWRFLVCFVVRFVELFVRRYFFVFLRLLNCVCYVCIVDVLVKSVDLFLIVVFEF